jgi:hypothetical protein
MGSTAEALIFTPCMIIYSLSYGGLASLQEPIRADYFWHQSICDNSRDEPVCYHGRYFSRAHHCRLSVRRDEELYRCLRYLRCRERARDVANVFRETTRQPG